MDQNNPFSEIFAAMARKREENERSHTHAKEFARALADEIEAARRVGACQICINNELLLAAIRQRFSSEGEIDPQKIAILVPAIANDIMAVIAGVAIDLLAEQKMHASAATGGAQ